MNRELKKGNNHTVCGCRSNEISEVGVVYYESIKRVKYRKRMTGCRCNENSVFIMNNR